MESLQTIDEDDYEVVELEEILLSDFEDDEPTPVKENPAPAATTSQSTTTPKIGRPKKTAPEKSATKSDGKKSAGTPTTYVKYTRKPTRPVRLFSYSDSDIIHKFSLSDPGSKDLAMKLLNIVKSVNTRRKLKVENGAMVPNFYIMATFRELDSTDRKITALEYTDIVNLVKDIVHMIKIGVYRKVNDIEIICDSPAIFLIKYISVKNWTSNMNAVYVVTSEYLLPYLCKIRAAEEAEENAKKRVHSVVARGKRKSKPSPAPAPVKKPKSKETPAKKPEPKLDIEVYSAGGSFDGTDEDTVERILSKYLEPDAVYFFLTQMKVGGRNYNRCRWTEEDKLFALNLLRQNATEYSILYQKYMLPSDKTLEKFMRYLQCEQIDNIRIDEDE